MKPWLKHCARKPMLESCFKDGALFREAAFINGEWVTGSTTLAVRNPPTAKSSATFPIWAAPKTRRAIDAANAAFPEWRAFPATKRSALLEAWFNAITQHTDDLAKILTVDRANRSPKRRARSSTAPVS
jgi:succinate-semialdehyde dehydrogenase/glutarate-semialdehyde dehydrogenase